DYKKFKGKNQLFINNGAAAGGLTFTERAAEYGLNLVAFCTQAVFFDYDLDGDLDCFVLCHSVHSSGSYRDTSQSRRFDPLASDRLYRNDNGHFNLQSGIGGGASGYGLGVVAGDLNGDGYPDLYVANDFHENDYLYYNMQGKYFREDIAGSMGHTSNFSMGCDLADFNNDARPDLVTLDMQPGDEPTLKASQPADAYDVYTYKHSLGYHWQFPRNNLQLNRGGTPANRPPVKGGTLRDISGNSVHFSEIGQLAGVATTDWSWSALFADLDLDGWKDLYITNGIQRRPNDMDYLKFISSGEVQQQATDLQLIEKMPAGAVPNYGYRNQQDLSFEDVSQNWGLAQRGCSNGAVYADLDNDGDLDLVTNNLNAPASVLRNNTTGANWLQIKFQGTGKNPFGIGAAVKIWAGGQMQFYENQCVRGFQSSVAPVLNIGLGAHTSVDSLQVSWPGGQRQTLYQVAARQILKLEQSAAQSAKWTTPASVQLASQTVAAALPPLADDLISEKLLPWSLHTRGPIAAVREGSATVIVGNQLYVRAKSGALIASATLPVAGNISTATLFDADGDGDPDLYLGTGNSPDTVLTDYLLRNDGRGHFEVIPGALPVMREHTACVRPADFDGDGDFDLFVGGRAVGGAYGLAPHSFLLKNDGRGHYSDATALLPDNGVLGMVTDAQWLDTDGDRQRDLVVLGEWMAVTILHRTGAGFEKMEIPASAGLWNCLQTMDVDGDGDPDLVAGNLGLNSILRASPTEPLGLWIKDFDHNGSFDPVLTYYRQGRNCVFADKDLLISQLPMLKKQYVAYRKFSQSSFEEVFPAALREQAIHREVQVLASCWIENRGQNQWALHPLPMIAQSSPVFALLPGDFNKDGKPDLLIGGNFYEVQPSIGRFDASFGSLLLNDGHGNWQPVEPTNSGFWLGGPVRDLQFLQQLGSPRAVLVTRSGGGVEVITENRPALRKDR
ncbi:MAG: VCBS repeat-containing protein, partial [Saprospiraceae bacterium]